jgi:hypothetical protein
LISILNNFLVNHCEDYLEKYAIIFVCDDYNCGVGHNRLVAIANK